MYIIILYYISKIIIYPFIEKYLENFCREHPLLHIIYVRFFKKQPLINYIYYLSIFLENIKLKM